MGNIFSMYQTSEQELKRLVKDLVVALQLEDETKPTVKELDEKLRDLVYWETFALHLPQITQKDIDIIKREVEDDIKEQKQALFNKWLRVYPSASWEHVILALQIEDENNIAQTILQCLPEAALSPQKQLTPHEELTQETTLLTLSELHRLFAELSFECQRALKKLVQNKTVALSDFVDRIRTERAYNFEDLDGIEDGNQFFTVISQHYHFLDTHLLVVLVQQFLNPSEILDKLLAHVQKIKVFKKKTEIRFLYQTLQPFVIRSSNEAPVTIRVQNAWEQNEIWLVETLLQILFHLKDNKILKWFRVIPGSLTIIFLVPQHKIILLTELSKNKVQFLRLTGVFTLQVGEEYILQDEENEAYSFTQALEEAKEADDYQAVHFLFLVQQTVRIDNLGMSDSFFSSEQCLKTFIAGEKENAEWLLPQVEEPQLLRDEENGRTLLHWASRWGWLDTMVTLIEHYSCDPMSRSNDGSVPLHLACFYTNNIDMINYLIEKCKCDPNLCKRDDGVTPLHEACAGGNVTSAKYLITHYNCDTMCKYDGGYTPLHAACYNHGNQDLINYLVDECECNLMCRSDDGMTPLHSACGGGNVTLAKYLIKDCNCDPMCKVADGKTLLHIACYNRGNLDVISYLIDECKCNPMCKSDDGMTPLHEACGGGNVTLVKYLIEHYNCDPMCENNDGHIPLQTACSNRGNLDVISYLIDECKCDKMCRGKDGKTLLHMACAKGNLDVVKYLILECTIYPLCRDNNLLTPLHDACFNNHYRVADYLICACVANPTSRMISFVNISKDNNLKPLFQKFSKLKSCHTVDAYTKVFVLGNPEVGKSTLTKVVKLRSNGNFFFGQYRFVSGVELHTAGIIPHRLEHRELGNIILHDLAGQPEYYSSHIAVLENIMQGSAAVFIVVVKLSEEAPYKWLSIVKDLSSPCSSTCYLLTVASHADSVEGGEVRRRELAQELEGNITSFIKDESRLQNMGVVYLDCRKLYSEQFSVFKGILSKACQTVQKDSSPMCVEHQEVLYCRMVYLLMETNGKDIYTIDELRRMISDSNDYYLPETDDQLLLTLYSLHCTGLIMFINTPGCSWIVFRKDVLLTEVTGKMFRSKEFQASLASNTGIVSKKSLCENFAQYDPGMLVGFLLSVKLCDKITRKMMEMTNLSPKNTDNDENELFFFPALMSYNKGPVMSFDMNSNERVDDNIIVLDKPFQFGWYLQCSNEHSFLSPRFLHLLILRLAYQYSLPKLSHNPHDLRCTIWSTGILWNSEYGVKTLVELVNDSQSVILLMSSQKELEQNMIPLRRRVIIDILSIREEICPSVHVKEYVIDPSQLDYPISKPSSLVLYDIEAIALCIAQYKPCVVSYTKNCQGVYDSKMLKDLLPLEYDRGQDMSIFVGRDIETLKLPGGLKLPNTVLSSPVGVLRKHSAVIQDVVSDPERLANTLYSVELISFSVKDEVLTTLGLSRYRKASIVVSEVERNMSGTDQMKKFSRLCEVMKAQRDQPLCEIVIKMEKEVDSSYEQRREE